MPSSSLMVSSRIPDTILTEMWHVVQSDVRSDVWVGVCWSGTWVSTGDIVVAATACLKTGTIKK